jgi:hypothetical protein
MMPCGFASLGFGFGMVGTLSVLQEYEGRNSETKKFQG